MRPVLLAVVSLLVLAPGASAAKVCRQVHPERDLAPARAVKLFERQWGDETALSGCVMPRGKVRNVSYFYPYEGSSQQFTVQQVAGATVLYREDARNDIPESSSTTYVYDLRTGHRYAIAEEAYTEDHPDGEPGNSRAVRAIVTARGEAVAAVRAGAALRIVGFSARGARRVLDEGTPRDIPARALTLRGTVASWTHGAEYLSAELPRPCSGYRPGVDHAPGSYAKLFVRRLAPTVSELVGCVMPDGPLRSVTTEFHYANTTRVFRIRDVAGPIVAVYQLRNDDVLPSEEETFVFDLGSGRRSTVDARPAAVIRVLRDGSAVAALGDPGAGNEIVTFAPGGGRRVLDSGPQEELPAGSLRLRGRIASWTHAGELRSAEL
jgi:hypothetical protein